MFDWFFTESDDAISQLKRDHDKVKDLFNEFESAGSRATKRSIARKALAELKIHSDIEEEIFYPTVRQYIESDIMNEADEEHHIAKVLIAELEEMDGRGDHFDAKFAVLAENVRHHIKEEESEMLPEARRLGIDYDELGQQMLRRREELESAKPRARKRTAA